MNRALELRLRERIDETAARNDDLARRLRRCRNRYYAMRASRDLWRHRALNR